MNINISETFAVIVSRVQEVGLIKGGLFLVFFLLVLFLPALLALIFNRRHFVKILLANIPAIMSWAVWGALIVWALSGKMSKSRAGKNDDCPAPEVDK